MTTTSTLYGLTRNDPAFFPPTVRVVRHLVSFLKWRFSLLPSGAYHWDAASDTEPDQKGSEIWIGSDTPLKSAAIGSRPAITVLRSQLAFQGIGIGDRASADLRTGGRGYMDLMPTTLVINVLSRIDIVAERLAFFVQEQIFTMREELVKTEPCLLYMGSRTNMAPPSPAGTLIDTPQSDWVCVAMALPTFLQHATHKTPLNKTIVGSLNPTIRGR